MRLPGESGAAEGDANGFGHGSVLCPSSVGDGEKGRLADANLGPAGGGDVPEGASRERQRDVEVHHRVKILLDYGEASGPGLGDRLEDRRVVGDAERRFDHDAAADGRHEVDVVLEDVGEDVRFDLLEVEVADPVGNSLISRRLSLT